MEVSIVSRESIKPSSPSIKNKKPHELCLFDQLFPLTYITGVSFYNTSSDLTSTHSETLAHMKESLSATLNLYYPFSGRIKDEIYVDDFDSGVPFLEARVDCRIEEYCKRKDADLINQLVPFPSFRRESNGPTPIPMLAVQANFFSCGGVAMAFSVCHKLADAVSMFYFFYSWAALHRGKHDEVIIPNFSKAAILFPAVRDLPKKYSDLFDQATFQKGNYVMKTFIFDSKAVETLRDKARSELVSKPTRNEAVTGFIWKHAVAASGNRTPFSLARQTMNLRGRLKSLNGIGNLYWFSAAVASTDVSVPERTELPELVKALKRSMEEYQHMLDDTAGEGYADGSGSKALLSKLDGSISILEQLGVRPQEITFSNWKGFFNEIDFGLGKSIKVGAIGNPGPESLNSVFLIDSQSGNKGIEATMVLEEKLMAALESDVNFLAFASPNSTISRL